MTILNDKKNNNNIGVVASHFCFHNKFRYFVLLLSSLALTLVTGNSVALNFTIICMNKERRDDQSILNSNSSRITVQDPENLMFTLNQQSALFSAIAIGTFVGGVPLTSLINKFGFRRMFTFYGMLSSIATFLTPWAAYTNFYVLVVLRISQGLAVAISFVSMAAICNAWAPLTSSGLFLCVLSCSYQLAMIFTMPIAGELCESRWRWPSVFYLQGTLSAIALFIFYYFYRDQARQQSYVSQQEIAAIELGKINTNQDKKNKQKVPYKAMCKDTAVWGVLSASSGSLVSYYLFVLYGPIYLNKTLNMDIEKTGLANALPYGLSIAAKLSAGPLSDRIICISEKTRVIILSCISQFGTAGCFVALKFLPTNHHNLVQASFTASTVFNGLIHVGVFKGNQLMSQHFAPVIQSWNAIISSIIVLVIPIFVSVLAPDNTSQQWGRIFITVAGYMFAATMFYSFTAKVKPRPWTQQKDLPS